jgi:cytochrome c oxidase cbb3-type subunit 3
MSDFTHAFWPLFVSGVTLVSIVGCALLLVSMSKGRKSSDAEQTGHVWDEDLVELNNPLPRWWIVLFWVTIAFGLVYLAWYPGLGTWKGGGWTSVAQYEDEMRYAERLYGPIYQRFAATDIKALAADPQARAAGEKLFLNYCTQCHASDARGGKGFPNLTDTDWLYGGDPQTIEKTILDGRNGMMPAWGPVLKEEGVRDAANYVRSLSGLAHDAARAERGKTLFATYCAACHGPDGKGNMALGAPNLTDQVWLYGSSEATIMETIARGRNNHMPAHRELLGEPRVHVLAAYVYGLSHPEAAKGAVPVAATR